MKKRFSYNLQQKCGQSDLHWSQKFLASSSVRKELTLSQMTNFRFFQIQKVGRQQF